MKSFTIEEIISNANIICDDNVDGNTLFIFLNNGITRLNSECDLDLPLITMDNVISEPYKVSEKSFVNNMISQILTNYIAFAIKQSEGYTSVENPFYAEYLTLKMNFQQKYKQLIKPEYQLDNFEDGSHTQGYIKNQKILKGTKAW